MVSEYRIEASRVVQLAARGPTRIANAGQITFKQAFRFAATKVSVERLGERQLAIKTINAVLASRWMDARSRVTVPSLTLTCTRQGILSTR